MNRLSDLLRHKTTVALGVFALCAANVGAAHAIESQTASCDSAAGVGQRTPVLLVHGFNSGEGTWSQKTQQYLATDVADVCVTTFDYSRASTEWVTEPRIGRALAERLIALGSASADASGPGKVVVVAHSMGGLATRCATSPSCSGVDGAANHLRALITFGTPHLGSHLRGSEEHGLDTEIRLIFATACSTRSLIADQLCQVAKEIAQSPAGQAFTPGSEELEALPTLPPDIPVLALAGSIEITTSFWGRPPTALGSAGDLIVGEASALEVHHSSGGVGGEKVVDCGQIKLDALLLSEVACSHVSETSDTTFLAYALNNISKIRTQDEVTLNNRACDQTAITRTACEFIDAVISGDLSGLTETERQ